MNENNIQSIMEAEEKLDITMKNQYDIAITAEANLLANTFELDTNAANEVLKEYREIGYMFQKNMNDLNAANTQANTKRKLKLQKAAVIELCENKSLTDEDRTAARELLAVLENGNGIPIHSFILVIMAKV